MSTSVPAVMPDCKFIAGSFGTPRLLAYRFPSIPGVPTTESDYRRFHAASATGDGNPESMPQKEWLAYLAALAGDNSRADYHLARFSQTVELMRKRRAVAGGPVFGDPEAARAVRCEAAAYLSAARTLIDLVVYVAARRAGTSEDDAEGWSASEAILKPEKAKYKSSFEVTLLRQKSDWFKKLNMYRNCLTHRGWHQESFGMFETSDTVMESNNPFHNVMLLPDLDSLEGNARPHRWRYANRLWLDTYLTEVRSDLLSLLDALCEHWSISVARPGTLPSHEHANVFLTIPIAKTVSGQTPPVVHIFSSRKAVRSFFEQLEAKGYGVDAVPRSIRPTKLKDGDAYLVGWDTHAENAEVQLVQFADGRAQIAQKLKVVPEYLVGKQQQILILRLEGVMPKSAYILE